MKCLNHFRREIINTFFFPRCGHEYILKLFRLLFITIFGKTSEQAVFHVGGGGVSEVRVTKCVCF